MRKIVLLAATIAVGTIGAAAADELTLICESPRHEYVVRFNAETNAFRADDTDYRVLAVERDEERLVVVGLTVNDGPTFRAHFRPYKKMEFFAENQLMQTDGCR